MQTAENKQTNKHSRPCVLSKHSTILQKQKSKTGKADFSVWALHPRECGRRSGHCRPCENRSALSLMEYVSPISPGGWAWLGLPAQKVLWGRPNITLQPSDSHSLPKARHPDSRSNLQNAKANNSLCEGQICYACKYNSVRFFPGVSGKQNVLLTLYNAHTILWKRSEQCFYGTVDNRNLFLENCCQ